MKKEDFCKGQTVFLRENDGRAHGKQIDRDCILYEIVKDGSKKNRTAGEQGRMSAASFCAWAKQEVSDGPV